jgi:hypothetical protein
MAPVSQRGMTRPAPVPFFGQIAPKMYADCVRWSCGAEGRVPRFAQRRVILFFWPTRAFAMGLGPMAAFMAHSANHSSISVPHGSASRISARRAGKSF